MSNGETVEIKKRLEELERRVTTLETSTQARPAPVEKGISIKEFILSKKPKNDVQRTLTIGYYLEKHQRLPSFNVKDIENAFRAAKEKVPKNIPDTIQKNVSKGHMTEAKEKKENLKAYYLTNTGEQFVENDFKKSK